MKHAKHMKPKGGLLKQLDDRPKCPDGDLGDFAPKGDGTMLGRAGTAEGGPLPVGGATGTVGRGGKFSSVTSHGRVSVPTGGKPLFDYGRGQKSKED